MKVDSTRTVPEADARSTLPTLVDLAIGGRPTHISRDHEVVAHLVAPETLVLTDEMADLLIRPLIDGAAVQFADGVENDGYQHAGNGVGQILGWLWESRNEAVLRWLGRYAQSLDEALTARHIRRAPFEPFWKSVRTAVAAYLSDDDTAAFDAGVRRYLTQFTAVFTAEELSGRQRARHDDDPWPDVTARGKCFAKKRWADIRVGNLVPDQPGSDLDFDDGWCRVEHLDTAEVVLRDSDGQDSRRRIDDTAVWTPCRGREPWQWGMPIGR